MKTGEIAILVPGAQYDDEADYSRLTVDSFEQRASVPLRVTSYIGAFGPRSSADAYNAMAAGAFDAEWFVIVRPGDRCATDGWDEAVRASPPGLLHPDVYCDGARQAWRALGMMFGNDVPIVHRSIVDGLGHVSIHNHVPEYLQWQAGRLGLQHPIAVSVYGQRPSEARRNVDWHRDFLHHEETVKKMSIASDSLKMSLSDADHPFDVVLSKLIVQGVFFHMPRTGGLSVRKAMGGRPGLLWWLQDRLIDRPTVSGANICKYQQGMLDGAYLFTFVRDPVARFISACRMAKQTWRLRQLKWQEVMEIARDVVASGEIKDIPMKPKFGMPRGGRDHLWYYLLPQAVWLDHWQKQVGREMDWVGRSEYLEQDWHAVCDRLIGKRIELPQEGVTVRPPMPAEEYEEISQSINELYAADFTRFGYPIGEPVHA
jgi:hypothetical protein